MGLFAVALLCPAVAGGAPPATATIEIVVPAAAADRVEGMRLGGADLPLVTEPRLDGRVAKVARVDGRARKASLRIYTRYTPDPDALEPPPVAMRLASVTGERVAWPTRGPDGRFALAPVFELYLEPGSHVVFAGEPDERGDGVHDVHLESAAPATLVCLEKSAEAESLLPGASLDSLGGVIVVAAGGRYRVEAPEGAVNIEWTRWPHGVAPEVCPPLPAPAQP